MRTVLITGGAIGIGRATAKAFAADGWRVIVTDVLQKEGKDVVQEIKKEGGTATFYSLDVTSTEEAEKVLDQVNTTYGSLASIVCNAGIAHKVPFEEMTDEKWDHTFDVDLKGMIRTLKSALSENI